MWCGILYNGLLYDDGALLVEVLESFWGEVRSQIDDDGVGEVEPVQYVTDEIYNSVYTLCGHRLVLDTLCEIVDGDQHIGESSYGLC